MALVNREPQAKGPKSTDDYFAEEVKRRTERLLEYAKQDRSYSGLHPAKHWAFARIDTPTMKAIGEDPGDFEKFRDGFRNAIVPNDDFEDLLACKMVEARWRQFRLLRAEAAILARGRCEFVMRQLAGQGRPFGADVRSALAGPGPSTGPAGATAGPEGGSRFTPLVKFLKTVRAAVVSEGFQGPSLKLLESVSGSEAGTTEALVAANYEHAQAAIANDGSGQEQHVKNFLAWLDAEIAAFEGLVQLDCAAEAELSGYAFDSLLLLPDKELEKISRYQAHTQREFDNAFKRLMEWRKMRAAQDAQRRQEERERGIRH